MIEQVAGHGYVYLLRSHDGWYRIGRTHNPNTRFKERQLEAKNGGYTVVPVALVEVPNMWAVERFFHSVFDCKRQGKRRRRNGPRSEWFKLDRYDVRHFMEWGQIIGRTFILTAYDGKTRLECIEPTNPDDRR